MVYFVGAGPGAVDLITVRGQKLIETADVIVFAGSLVNEKILDAKKTDCETFNSAQMTLDEVIDVLTSSDKAGKKVVRLHTGDPSIYGAIREQMGLLDKACVEYAVVPGVSSFLGAAAALNAEFTLPGVSQTVILTRMEGRTPVPEAENIQALASHGASMAIFLTTSMLSELTRRLIEGGYKENTLAAIVYKATWDDQKIVRTTVGNLEKSAKDHEIKKTAMIFVGNFLGDDYELSKLYDPTFSHEFRTASR